MIIIKRKLSEVTSSDVGVDIGAFAIKELQKLPDDDTTAAHYQYALLTAIDYVMVALRKVALRYPMEKKLKINNIADALGAAITALRHIRF
jgi:hypothetical protein